MNAQGNTHRSHWWSERKKKEPQTQRVFRPLMDQANQVTSEAKDLARQFLASHVKEAVCCNIIHYFANGSGTPLW